MADRRACSCSLYNDSVSSTHCGLACPEATFATATAESAPLEATQIVAAALAHVDRHGLANFSVRKLARELGVYPTALSWHVGTRNQLLADVVSLALAGVTPPRRPRDASRWQPWVRELMVRYRAALRRHPNVAPLLSAQLTSNAAVSLDIAGSLVRTLAEAGFDGGELTHAYNSIVGGMIGWVGLELAPNGHDAGVPEQPELDLRRRLDAIDPALRSTVHAHHAALCNKTFVLRWQNGESNPLDDSFEAFVDALLAGIETTSARRHRARGRRRGRVT